MAKHIHKFLRVPAKKTRTWTCTECNWFVHDGLSHILLTKDAECWGCGETFRITEIALREDKPRCDICRGMAIDEFDLDAYMEQLRKQNGEENE